MAEQSPPARIRLNLISEVAFEGDNPRPIHMFRPGTYTDMSGRETSFTAADVASIVARFNANKRRKPPITERHDFGRAIGRVQDIWTDADHNLYGMPKWNADGRKLLEDEIYDGFSCELDPTSDGWALIGGSLTNYPAVGDLEPVSLAAPPLTPAPIMAPLASVPARVHTAIPTIKEFFMSEQLPDVQAADPPALPPIALPPVNDAAMQAQINAYTQQMEARYQANNEAAFQRAQQEFERRITEMEARRQIEGYAQNATTATLTRQHALPIEADALVTFLSSLNTSQRLVATGLFDRVLDAGLVSFEEIGSAGGDDPRAAAERWDAAIALKVGTGMARSNAIASVMKEQPELYREYSTAGKKGGR